MGEAGGKADRREAIALVTSDRGPDALAAVLRELPADVMVCPPGSMLRVLPDGTMVIARGEDTAAQPPVPGEGLDGFRARLSDALRALSDPGEIEETASRMITGQLGAERSFFTELDPETGELAAERGYQLPGSPAPAGSFPVAAFEPFAGDHQAGRAAVVPAAAADPRLPAAVRQRLAELRSGAFIGVPVVAAGECRVLFTVSQPVPRDWTAEEVALVAETAGRAWAEVERARAGEAVRDSEARLAFLLALSDALRPVADAAEAERVAARMLGEHLGADQVQFAHMEGEGATVYSEYRRDGVPSSVGRYRRQDWSEHINALRRVRPFAAGDTHSAAAGAEGERARWTAMGIASIATVPVVRDGEIAGALSVRGAVPHAWTERELAFLEDAAERVWSAMERAQAEQSLRERAAWHGFSLKLTDALRPLDDAAAIQREASRVLGEQLGADRVFFLELAEAGGVVYAEVPPDYCAPGVASLAGRSPIGKAGETGEAGDFSTALSGELRAGRSLVVMDTADDPRAGEERFGADAPPGMRAYIGVPVRAAGPPSAFLGVHQSQPRAWTDFELLLTEETAERAWAEVERARAGAAAAAERRRHARREREFAANAAHELRTPLSAIVASVEALAFGAKDLPMERDRFLGHLRRESARLGRLSDTLLLIAHADAAAELPKAAVRVAELLEEAAADQRLPDGVTIAVEADDGLTVMTHRGLVGHIVSSLCQHAIRRTAGGRIDLRGYRDGDAVVVEVRGTGSAIAATEAGRALDRFYRTELGLPGGLGLGLSIARQAAAAVGGELTVTGGEGGGALARLRLTP